MNDKVSAKIYGPDGTLVEHLVGVGSVGMEGQSLRILVDGKQYHMTGIAVAHVIPERKPGLEDLCPPRFCPKDFVLYGSGGEELLRLEGVAVSISYGTWIVHTDREDGSYYNVIGGTVVVTDLGSDMLAEAIS